MTGALAGLFVGAAAAAISELMLRYWRANPSLPAMRVYFMGLALRTGWILAALVVTLAFGWFEGAAFPAVVFATYLATQIWEGFRYKRFIQTK